MSGVDPSPAVFGSHRPVLLLSPMLSTATERLFLRLLVARETCRPATVKHSRQPRISAAQPLSWRSDIADGSNIIPQVSSCAPPDEYHHLSGITVGAVAVELKTTRITDAIGIRPFQLPFAAEVAGKRKVVTVSVGSANRWLISLCEAGSVEVRLLIGGHPTLCLTDGVDNITGSAFSVAGLFLDVTGPLPALPAPAITPSSPHPQPVSPRIPSRPWPK